MEEKIPVGSTLFFDASEASTDEYGSMSCLSAVEALLIEVGSPLNGVGITDQIIKRKLWVTEGKTPAATVTAQLAVDIKKHGCNSRFQRTAPNLFALRSWGLEEYVKSSTSSKGTKSVTSARTKLVNGPVISSDLNQQIQNHNKIIFEKLHEHLLNMPPAEFELLIGDLLIALGFEDVEVTNHHGDGGIDVRGTLVVGEVIRTKMAVQVKRWKKNVQAPTVQQVRGSLGTHDQGLIITTSNFSTGARTEASRSNAIPVALMNGTQLVRLLTENNLGVRRTQHDLFELEVNSSLSWN